MSIPSVYDTLQDKTKMQQYWKIIIGSKSCVSNADFLEQILFQVKE